MNGRQMLWRRRQRDRRTSRWSVRLRLAEARMRRDFAWLHGF